MAADELEAWELSAMRDPRNWVRPAAALVVGGTAGAALVLLRARRRAHGDHAAPGDRTIGRRAACATSRRDRRLLGPPLGQRNGPQAPRRRRRPS